MCHHICPTEIAFPYLRRKRSLMWVFAGDIMRVHLFIVLANRPFTKSQIILANRFGNGAAVVSITPAARIRDTVNSIRKSRKKYGPMLALSSAGMRLDRILLPLSPREALFAIHECTAAI